MIQEEAVHLGDQLEEGHTRDERDVIRIPAQDDQRLEQQLGVLHRLERYGALIALVFACNR